MIKDVFLYYLLTICDLCVFPRHILGMMVPDKMDSFFTNKGMLFIQYHEVEYYNSVYSLGKLGVIPLNFNAFFILL